MRTARKVLMSVLAVALAATAIAAATWSSFSSTTANPSNGFSAGTVNIADDDAGATFSLPNMTPGYPPATGCIQVTYTGSLNAAVHLYGSSTGGLAQYLNLSITRGSESAPSFPSCTTFTADATNYIGLGAGVVYSGTLANFMTNYSSFANGLVDAPGSGNTKTWATNDAHSYEFTFTLPSSAPAAAQGLSATASLNWEAQNT
ncbi:MAG TPA: hypothetical protein VGI67_22400 [Thermoleophilaceae bacterium]|jgi:hypothetical protein